MRKVLQPKVYISVIILVALLFRLWGINFGLPDKYIIDEETLVYQALYAGGNKLHPVNYYHPQLIPIFLFLEFGIYYGFGKIIGVFSSPENFNISYQANSTILFLIGRISMAFIGVFTVWLIYIIGKKFFNLRVGLLSALFLSVCFLHVKESHYIKQDILSTFLLLVSFYFLLEIQKIGRLRYFLLSGVFFALAVAIKYNSILFFPVVIVTLIQSKISHKFRKISIFIFFSILVFFVINPYIIFEPQRAYSDIVLQFNYLNNELVNHTSGNPVWWYLNVHIPYGLGWILYILGWFGFGSIIIKFRNNKYYLLISVFPAIFIFFIALFTKTHVARYALIIVPFWIMSAAIFVDFLADFIKKRRWQIPFLILITLLVVWQPVFRIAKFDFLLTRPDTRAIGRRWIEKNIPAGSKIAVESMLKPDSPSNLNVSLFATEAEIQQRIDAALKINYPATFLKAFLKARKNKIGYVLTATPRIDYLLNIHTDELTILANVDFYSKNNIKYIVLSSWTIKPDIKEDFMKSLISKYELIKEFNPNPIFPTDPHFIRLDYSLLDDMNIFCANLIFGPKIQIFELNN